MAGNEHTRQPTASTRLAILHLAGLGALAVAHPLLDLLARQPEYLAVQGFSFGRATLLATLLVALTPAVYAPLRLGAGIWLRSPGSRRALDTVAVGLLAALLVLPWVQRGFPGGLGLPAALLLAPAAAFGAGWLYFRFPAARTFTTFLVPAALLVPAAFLLDPDIRRLGHSTEPGDRPPLALPEPEADPSAGGGPVVVVLFDELSQSALLRPDGEIDPLRYPHLASLAERSTWFEHAYAVAKQTAHAVPALLTGRFPEPGRLPVLQDHPRNLFTLLGGAETGAYRIAAQENTTRLCPPGLNAALAADQKEGPWSTNVGQDLAILYGHLMLPRALADRLPAVDQTWGNFAATARAPGEDRVLGEGLEETRAFLSRIEAQPRRTLYYVHVAIPHLPLERLPSGKTYLVDRPRYSIRRAHGGQLRHLFYQRYLLQVGLVDRLVGELVGRLEELEVFDEALVVITSDHGLRLLNRPGSAEEDPARGDWLRIPLLIKRPFQQEGEVDPSPATTLDLVPTILSLLGTEPPPDLEGRPLLGPAAERSTASSTQRFYLGSRARLRDDATLTDRGEVLRWIEATYGPSTDPDAIFRAGGPHRELWGRFVEELAVVPEPGLSALFDAGTDRVLFDPEADSVPILSRATLYRSDPPFEAGAGCCDLALAVNGVIEATTRTFDYPGQLKKMTVLFPPRVLEPGENRLELFRIAADGSLRRPAGSEDVAGRLDSATLLPFGSGPRTLLEVAREAETSGAEASP